MSAEEGRRLSMRTLAAARALAVPTYDRVGIPVLVHVGVGAFSRAHLGVYADALLRDGWPATIRGVSLHSRRAEEQLVPQDGLYTVTEREPGRRSPARVIGALTSVGTGAAAAIDAIAAPTTKLVTLTVTEKGYEMDPDDPDVTPSAAVVVARGLAAHRAAGTSPPTIASLDNLLDNGRVLRDRVLQVAQGLDPDLATWIADVVPFPCSVVDRMVPATTPADLTEIGTQLGLVDLAATVTEHHCSWVIADEGDLPPLAEVGVQVVGDIAPFQQRKLWLLNGPHSAVAYCGVLGGCATIAEALDDDAVASFVRRLVDEILEVVDLPAALGASTFAADALRRFHNPGLGHTCAQVGTDGSRKLPQRLLPVVAARRQRGLRTTSFATVVAIWIAAVSGIAVQGMPLTPLDDPAGSDLVGAAAGGDLDHLAHVALHGWSDPTFGGEVVTALQRLGHEGRTALGQSR
jgi:fructuronate reductase